MEKRNEKLEKMSLKSGLKKGTKT